MTAQTVAEIMDTYDDALRLIRAALAPDGPPPDLPALRARLRRRMDQLLGAWMRSVSEEAAAEALVPLAFFLDEFVQQELVRRYPTDRGPRWPLLQRDLFPDGQGDGGDVFFEQADVLARRKAPAAVVVESYLFCLCAGFTGRYFDDPTELLRIRSRLADCLPQPPALDPATSATSVPHAWPAWRYLVLAILAVACSHGAMALLALQW